MGSGSESDFGSQLEGDMAVPGQRGGDAAGDPSNGDFNTLDEPIMLTIVSGILAPARSIEHLSVWVTYVNVNVFFFGLLVDSRPESRRPEVCRRDACK
jgi:hypothetical protein